MVHHRHTDGHGDSTTDPAQRAKSVKIDLITYLTYHLSKVTKKKKGYSVLECFMELSISRLWDFCLLGSRIWLVSIALFILCPFSKVFQIMLNFSPVSSVKYVYI